MDDDGHLNLSIMSAEGSDIHEVDTGHGDGRNTEQQDAILYPKNDNDPDHQLAVSITVIMELGPKHLYGPDGWMGDIADAPDSPCEKCGRIRDVHLYDDHGSLYCLKIACRQNESVRTEENIAGLSDQRGSLRPSISIIIEGDPRCRRSGCKVSSQLKPRKVYVPNIRLVGEWLRNTGSDFGYRVELRIYEGRIEIVSSAGN